MIIFNDTLGVYGGAQTLMLRMCTWLRSNGIATAIITDSTANIEIVERLQKIDAIIECVDRNKIQSYVNVLSKFTESEDIKVISFVCDFYLEIEMAKKAGNMEFDNLMYCIHPEAFNRGNTKSKIKSLLKKPIINAYRNLFIKMNENNSLYIMDEVDTIESEKYLNVSLKKKPEIIRLPMICNKKDEFESIINDGYDSQMILTAARAEYPYKGYIFGLLDAFVEIKEENPKLKMTIVSGGGDLEQFNKKLDSLDDKIKEDLYVYKWMAYDSLLELAKKCKLFVGMGTSVLDMALCYKPSIAVKFNTYECIGDSFISEKPQYITTDENCVTPAIHLVKKILAMSKDEYREESIKSFDAVKSLYDIDYCMSSFMNARTNNKTSILSTKDYVFFLLYKKYISMKIKNEADKFDYNVLQKADNNCS